MHLGRRIIHSECSFSFVDDSKWVRVPRKLVFTLEVNRAQLWSARLHNEWMAKALNLLLLYTPPFVPYGYRLNFARYVL